MGPPSIGPIKEMVLGLELEPIRRSVGAALSDGADGVGIRELLLEWAAKQNLPV
jgi:phosphotransferase system enzyme I (PtsP)